MDRRQGSHQPTVPVDPWRTTEPGCARASGPQALPDGSTHVPQHRHQAGYAAYAPPQHCDGPAPSWRRSSGDRALARPSERGDHAGLHSCRHATKRKGARSCRRPNHPARPVPARRSTPRVPRRTLIMPNSRMANARRTNLPQRSCGIISVTALCALCRDRHKAHASGHPSRLNRSTLNESYRFGDTNYAKEELRAELASVFIAAETGIPHDPKSHAAYVGSWIQALKEDKHEIFRAAHDASELADYILGPHRSQQLQAAAAVRETTDLVARAEPGAGTTAVHQKKTGDERRTINEKRPVTEQVRDGQTASRNAVPLNEANAVAVQALGNGVRTFSAQTESGVYRGAVVGDTDEHVVQRVSSRSAVAHRKADLDTTPMTGQNV